MKTFEYLENCTEQEKENLAQKLKDFYNDMVEVEENSFQAYINNKRSVSKRNEYKDCVTRLGAFNDLLELLHIDVGQNEF